MRDGTKTILSMQNRYDGPVDNFAMVIPVPQVLMEANVKTLSDELFTKIDTQSAPRLVEYFEEDPCYVEPDYDDCGGGGCNNVQDSSGMTTGSVTVEAEFQVGEYEIVVLGADDSTALETWLSENEYSLPDGAAPYYQPYIDAGMYFFVARVDATKVRFEGSRAVLSPLRFDYDSDTFSLPIRLGMINSAGQQDIIIHTLGRSQRYEAANYDNVTVPTNLELDPTAKDTFATFYKTLFARTVDANPDAIVTEYAWRSSSCDPCPGATLDESDLLSLGADIIGGESEYDRSWVLTRMHARFAKDEVGEDIVFAAAEPIVGGREFVVGDNGELEVGATPSEENTFQGRYIIRHPWTGAIDCEEPTMGNWSDRTAGSAQGPTSTGGEVAVDGEYDLAPNLVDDVPELGISGTGSREAGVAGGEGGSGSKREVGGGCSTAQGGGSLGLLALLGFGWMRRRRR